MKEFERLRSNGTDHLIQFLRVEGSDFMTHEILYECSKDILPYAPEACSGEVHEIGKSGKVLPT